MSDNAEGAPIVPAGHLWPDYEAADKALAALGLDDLLAAEQRAWTAAAAIWPTTYDQIHLALEAALTPPEDKDV